MRRFGFSLAAYLLAFTTHHLLVIRAHLNVLRESLHGMCRARHHLVRQPEEHGEDDRVRGGIHHAVLAARQTQQNTRRQDKKENGNIYGHPNIEHLILWVPKLFSNRITVGCPLTVFVLIEFKLQTRFQSAVFAKHFGARFIRGPI